jgi:acyl-coenzyme A synthetase/AMP-(fatty) acid ligase/acyl carrier protein
MSAAREALHKSRSGSLQAALARLSDIIILVDQKFAELGSELLRDSGLPVFSLADVHTETRDPCDDCFAADPLYLVPSSGSTGRLKLVAVREETLLQRSFVKDFGKQHHELGTFALDSISGQNGVFVRCGSLTQMPVGALTTNPLSVLDAIEKYQISMASFTNSSIKRIIAAADQTNSSWQLTSLRQVGLGGETVVRELVARFAKFLERHGAPRGIIQAHYGTTETGSLVSGANPLRPSTDGHNAVCLGGCAPGVGLRIVGSDGELLPDGEIGNLQAICPQTIFSCYWGEPEQTRDCFTPDGWWKTGDLGCLHNGELSIHGRIKEVIVIEGKKLSLTKIDEEIETILDFGDRAFSCAVAWPGESAERLAVVFVPSTQHSIERFAQHADNIRDHIARRFGFRPYPVLVASLDEIPFANNGKLRRLDLASYIRSGSIGRVLRRMEPAKPNPLTASAQLETILEKLWREALDVRGPLDRQASFFDLGGDSLRSVMLHTAIEEHLNARVSAEAFFRSPTFDNLFQLIALRSKVASTTGTRDFSVPWPLGEDIRDKLLISFELWAGSRPTQDRLVAGLNTTGKKAPLFWVFQEAREFRQLAKSLGRDHPLYGFRSGIGVIKYEEDEIQAIALRYVSEITEVCPEGPVFVGGTCQGAVIALAIAQHLIRRKRHVPLLVLLEWGFPLEYYPGSVLLIYGRDSIEGNPYVRFRNPELGWTRVFGQYAVAEMPGDHGHLSEDCNVAVLAKTLIQHMERTERSPPKFVSEIGSRFRCMRTPSPKT